MLKCKEISSLISSDNLGEAGFMKRMEVRIHLMMCKHCARYFDQIKSVGQGAKELACKHEADPQQIQRMEEIIMDEVRDQDSD